MSLLHNILRPHNQALHADFDDDDDDLVNVVSLPGSPSRTRPPSPTRGAVGAASRPLPGPLHLRRSSPTDPLKALPTDVSQRIFAQLSIKELAKCARVSKKWSKSQTINYVWFQHYRKENFHDESLPPGKWTRRESKQNWRTIYLTSAPSRAEESTTPFRGAHSPLPSGYQTPREIKEEKWRLESEVASRPGKVQMREMYKELGGRKSKGKGKLGSTGIRDKGGWATAGGDDDGW
ncbi:hypothetical protein HGRIS_007301 [Hohenbuehelia grisea]|uniref:F-box domain-containing protein n=1 Tax=Hohenbuehelia grisea TaxID=104357 RepID=A0ABR3J4V8_9AGAR